MVALLTYAFQGIEEFATVFLPWELSANTYAIIIMSITTVYTLLGGSMGGLTIDLGTAMKIRCFMG